jgi:hypothetical protein
MKIILPAERGLKRDWDRAFKSPSRKGLHDYRRVCDVFDAFDFDPESCNVITDMADGIAYVHIPAVTPHKWDRVARALHRRAFPKSEWRYEIGQMRQDDNHNVITELIFIRRNHGKETQKQA